MSERWKTLVMGADAQMRLRLYWFFVSSVMYVSSGVMAGYAVWIGVWKPWQGWFDVCYLFGGHIASYAWIRSGSAQRHSDQTVTMVEIAFAVSATDLAYALGGMARAALLIIFAMHIVFMMLTLTPRQTQRLGSWTLASIVTTSAVCTWWRPAEFPWRLEVLHMGIALSILPVMLMAAVWVSRLRRTESQQTEQLREMTAKLEVLAQRDELTGLFNRRYMMGMLEAEFKRAQRGGPPLTIAMLDLDHFKRTNDTLGHHTGDRVLQVFAQAAGIKLRGTDVLCRWGGEEFLLLMPDTSAASAIMAVQRIRQELEMVGFRVEGHPVRITFSAGVAQWTAAVSVDQLLEQADKALYRAKDAGRNRTEMATV